MGIGDMYHGRETARERDGRRGRGIEYNEKGRASGRQKLKRRAEIERHRRNLSVRYRRGNGSVACKLETL